MLFDLNADPLEQKNLAEQRPEVLKEATWRFANWYDEQMFKMTLNASDSVDPLWTVMREGGPEHTRFPMGPVDSLEDYLKRLEATGRSEGARQLREKYGL